MSGFLGAGDVRMAKFNAATQAFEGFGPRMYANKFELKANAEAKEWTSKGKNDYGQTKGSVTIQRPSEFAMELKEANADAMAMLFLGTKANDSITGGTVLDEAVTARTGTSIQLARRAVSATTLTNAAGTTTYALGTDYTVDAALGLIDVVAGSALATAVAAAGATGLSLLVDYTYAASSAIVIKGATQPIVRVRILFDGVNLDSGAPVVIDVWDVKLRPEAGFDFLADDWASLPLSGSMSTPVGKDAPFEIRGLS